MPAKGPGFGSSGRAGGGRGRPYHKSGRGSAREVPAGSGTWISSKAKGVTKAQAAQNSSAKTYKTVDAARSAAAKKAAATRKANAQKAMKQYGTKMGLMGAAGGAAAGYASSYVGRGSEGPKKSTPKRKKK